MAGYGRRSTVCQSRCSSTKNPAGIGKLYLKVVAGQECSGCGKCNGDICSWADIRKWRSDYDGWLIDGDRIIFDFTTITEECTGITRSEQRSPNGSHPKSSLSGGCVSGNGNVAREAGSEGRTSIKEFTRIIKIQIVVKVAPDTNRHTRAGSTCVDGEWICQTTLHGGGVCSGRSNHSVPSCGSATTVPAYCIQGKCIDAVVGTAHSPRPAITRNGEVVV